MKKRKATLKTKFIACMPSSSAIVCTRVHAVSLSYLLRIAFVPISRIVIRIFLLLPCLRIHLENRLDV